MSIDRSGSSFGVKALVEPGAVVEAETPDAGRAEEVELEAMAAFDRALALQGDADFFVVPEKPGPEESKRSGSEAASNG